MIDSEILKDFLIESKGLIEQMQEILEKCESDFSQAKSLEQYGQNVDRIMGAAKSLAMGADKNHMIHKIGDYSQICKAVSYKASQIRDNEQFYQICVALLLDGTEVLEHLIVQMGQKEPKEFKELFSKTFLERLKWVSAQFSSEYRSSVDIHKGQKTKLNQGEIDDLLKKLGLD